MLGLRGRIVATTDADRAVGLTCSATDGGLLAAWLGHVGDRTPVAGLLDDLDRCARPARPWRTPVETAFTWDDVDTHTRTWVPQGITTSADARPAGIEDARRIVVVSWYSPPTTTSPGGARVTFVDLTAPRVPRYRHVLLAEPSWEAGSVATVPVPVHAGGIVWYDDLLYVASTYAGLRVFRLGDLVRVDPRAHGGHEYLLPQHWAYRPAGDPATRMRYSFVSLDRTATPHSLVAGEYGRGRRPTRIVSFALDPATGRPRHDGDAARPDEAFGLGVRGMQGVARVAGTYFVTASRGRFLPADLWVGDPDRGFRQHRWALPRGVEDVSAWPERGELWSLTEWPGHRMVFALRMAAWCR